MADKSTFLQLLGIIGRYRNYRHQLSNVAADITWFTNKMLSWLIYICLVILAVKLVYK